MPVTPTVAPEPTPENDALHLACVTGDALTSAAPWGEGQQTLPMPPFTVQALAGAGHTLVALTAEGLYRYDGAWQALGAPPFPPEDLASRGPVAVLYGRTQALSIPATGEGEVLDGSAVLALGPRYRAAAEPGFPDAAPDPVLGVVLALDEPSPWGGRLVAPEGGTLRWLDAEARDRTPEGLVATPAQLRGYGPGDTLLVDLGYQAVLAHPTGVVPVPAATGPCTWWWGPT